MRTESQLSVSLVNEPGRLAQVLAALAKAKVNIVAMTVTDANEHGILRVVVDGPDAAAAALRPLDLPVLRTEVLCVELANRPGAFATVAERLAREHVNVQYAYCTAGAPGGRTTAILKVDQVKKAQQVLDSVAGVKSQEKDAAIRRQAPAMRR